MIEDTIKKQSQVGNFLFALSKCCYHHFTFHGDIWYFAYIVSPYGNHSCWCY